MPSRDRTAALIADDTLNGIDFVEVAADQRTLRVHFLTDVDVSAAITGVTITGGEKVPTVPLDPIAPADWGRDPEGRPLLTLHARLAGDFSRYTLTLASPLLDPFFAGAVFSFKANCKSDLDCKAAPAPCPEDTTPLPPIDYLAKDFASFKQALSDYSALRYPGWVERSEADVGVAVLEALAALGDDLSYTQDRIAAEGALATATQRRSLVRQARIVDYEPAEATSARVLLQFNVSGGPIPVGVVVSARAADGTTVDFETGTGLADTASYPASPAWNGVRGGVGGIRPYVRDDSERCLRRGSRELRVHGHGFAFYEGQQLLLDTAGPSSADPPVRQVVTLVSSRPGLGDHAVEELDPLFPESGSPAPVTHIRWRAEDALLADHDLDRTTLAGNLVPATEGRRFVESFAIDTAPAAEPTLPLALVRLGRDTASWDTDAAPRPRYLHSLGAGVVTRLAPDGGGDALPEIALTQLPEAPATERTDWTWRRSLLDAPPLDASFTLDRGVYRRLQTNADGSVSDDYDGDGGSTIRFGDGDFGAVPDSGAVFRATYRVGSGARGNVAAGAIAFVDPAAPSFLVDVTNPFPGAGGTAEEPAERVRRLAPQAFRAVQYRAVRPEDYEAAARTLPWVDRAGTVFRWTGSWLTVFTAADATDVDVLPPTRRGDLVALLDRYRLAGYESYVPDPLYANLDVQVTVCARSDAFRGDVEAAVLAALAPPSGFFARSRFTFGTPLERSALEAAVQDAYGVGGVLSVQVRRRGFTADLAEMPDTVAVGSEEIVRVANDPSLPEEGSLRVVVEGGK